MDKTLAWLWLADAVGSGCQYARELLDLYPDPAELYDILRVGTEAPPACLSAHALAQQRDTTPFDYEERLDHCLLSGIDILTPDEGTYPDRLRDLPDLPLVLYVTGSAACLNGGRYAGMVGTRRPSAYGRQAAFDLSLAMAQAGVVLVSGMADGLDSEAHRAAVQAGVPTVAFLGTAIDKTYPAANAKLRTAIEKGGGAVCSEYPPGYTGRTTGTFLARNRLIARPERGALRGRGPHPQRYAEHRGPRRAAGPPGAGRARQHLQCVERGHERTAVYPPRRAAVQSRRRAGHTGDWRRDRRPGTAAV